MKVLISFLLIITTAIACKNKKTIPDVEESTFHVIDSTLITDTSWGAINRNFTFDSLILAYGETNVKDERICDVECTDSIDVTIIYPGADKQITVYWKDGLYHRQITLLETYFPASPYHTEAQLKINSTLKQLLDINGKPLNFSGFAWDYGGYVHSFNNGALEGSPTGFRLDLPEDTTTSLLGEIELNSDMPEVQRLANKIVVIKLSFSFEKQE